MPNVEDIERALLDQDVVWVGGGSVAGLLAMWRLHGVDEAMRAAWQAGVVLTGVSRRSLCWHVGGTTDSFGPTCVRSRTGSALMPVLQRRPLRRRGAAPPAVPPLVADGTLPAGLRHRRRRGRALPRRPSSSRR